MNSFTHLLPLRRSTLLISAAIFTMATAQAEIQIGRLPSVHAGDGQVVGAKPNVFLLIDNSPKMGGLEKQDGIDPKVLNGSLLQQTAAGLISALPQLEGKVRLGYSTIFSGRRSVERYYDKGNPRNHISCKDVKLNGNVSRLNPYIGIEKNGKRLNLEESLKIYNPKYLKMFGNNEDFVFGEYGSGFGEIIPRDFSGNVAEYVYAWLGGMCIGDTAEGGISSTLPSKHPPYGDLSNPTEYKESAKAANNKYSYSLRNYGSNAFIDGGSRPFAEGYALILSQISDKKIASSFISCKNDAGTNCSFGMDLSGKGGVWEYPHSGQVFDSKKQESIPFRYDAYAPTSEDRQGFPLETGALSCRKNYVILIAEDGYSPPKGVKKNTTIGVDIGDSGWGINAQDIKSDYFSEMYYWKLPLADESLNSNTTIGIQDKSLPITDYTRMYRFFLPHDSRFKKIPKDTAGVNGNFLFSKLALRAYYNDLRPYDLKNNVPAFYVENEDKAVISVGGKKSILPKEWNRKNDTANWQHLTTFALGFKNGFRAWQTAAEKFSQNYPNTDPNNGMLEPYFRAIEDGSIYETNAPLADWGRGKHGITGKRIPNYAAYIFKDRNNKVDYVSFPDGNFSSLAQMDYAKAGVIGRGGTYDISDYDSIRRVISMIASRIETAMAQGISGGAIGGGSRVTASQQAAGGNDSTLFTTYLDQENLSGNIFAFKNCPLIQEKIPDGNGGLKTNDKWEENSCGKRLWNAASALKDGADQIADKTIIPIKDGSSLSGKTFKWDNLDQELKTAFTSGGDDALGQARVNWLNGQESFSGAVSGKLRQRTTIAIPDEKQHYSYNDDGSLKRDDEGNLVLTNPTNITNLMGEIVYALPKAVDNRGTLPAAHPLNNQSYVDFLNTKVKNRKPMVLAGANDGHLYGFNTASSGENASLAFSFIPRSVVLKRNTNIVDFTKPEAKDKTGFADGLVNGPFTVKDAQVDGQWGTYVVGTLGEGGDAIYALDISTGQPSANMFKWEVSGRGYGNIMAEPRIVWLRSKKATSNEADGKWVVLLPTGYNGDTVSLIVLDLANGAELAKIDTHAKYQEGSSNGDNKTCRLASSADGITLEENVSIPKSLTCDNGLGALTVFDADSDSGADFVFAGDLMGHVWKFDLTGFFDKSSGNQASNLQTALKVAYNSPLFIAQTPGDNSTRQPITNMITIEDGAYGEGSMLYFGTGRMFNQRERELRQQESFYGVWDIPRYSEQANILNPPKQDTNTDPKQDTNTDPKQDTNTDPKQGFALPLRRDGSNSQYDFIRYETFVIPASDVKDPNSSLTKFKELRGVKRTDALTSSNYLSYDLDGKSTSNEKVVGWIIDFPSEDALERVINRAYAFEDTIFFPTFTPKGAAQEESCEPIRTAVGGEARFYMVDRLTGGQPETSPFDFNHDGTQDDNDGVKVNPSDLGKGRDLNELGYNKAPDPTDGKITLSPAGILIGKGNGDFLSVTGVLERSTQATSKHNCDYSRQVVFPSTVDPKTGNPLVLSSCNRNRYRVWKQPIIE